MSIKPFVRKIPDLFFDKIYLKIWWNFTEYIQRYLPIHFFERLHYKLEEKKSNISAYEEKINKKGAYIFFYSIIFRLVYFVEVYRNPTAFSQILRQTREPAMLSNLRGSCPVLFNKCFDCLSPDSEVLQTVSRTPFASY